MVIFRKISWLERLYRLYPPYQRKKEAEMEEAIRYLVENPQEPCIIGDQFIRNGFNE